VALRTGPAVGLRVAEVVSDGPAARAGIHGGDIVLTAAGPTDRERAARPRLVLADAIGSQLPITVFRNGALVDVIATPVELAG
jgi:S1-C subfamily serine protease